MALTSHTQSYLDFAGLAQLRAAARRDQAATLEQVAEQFEAVFMQMMMKSMRDAGFGDPLLGSRTVEHYRGMLDDQLSLTLGRSGSLGIAEMIKQQLEPLVAAQARGGGGRGGEPLALPVRPPAGQAAAPFTPVTDEGPGGASAPAGQRSTGGAFEDREAFVATLRPAAAAAGRRLGVAPDLLLAQAALETGWGRAVPRHADGSSSHNLFGIKADRRWDGPTVTLPTLEYRDGVARREQASFRAYESFAASFDDYADFLLAGPRYGPALERAGDGEGFVRALHAAGYATDPRYADKVLRIWRDELASI